MLKLDRKDALLIFLAVEIFVLGEVFDDRFAFAFGPSNPECYEIGNCDFFTEPLDAMTQPFQTVFGPFTFVLLWSMIIGILWLRVGNTMVIGVIGVALAVLFQPQFTDDAQLIGFTLLAIAVAVALFQILTVRSHFPSN